MDKYVVLTTYGDHMITNQLCNALETAGVPVLVEHLLIEEGKLQGTGFRVLIPSHLIQTGYGILSTMPRRAVANDIDAFSAEYAA